MSHSHAPPDTSSPPTTNTVVGSNTNTPSHSTKTAVIVGTVVGVCVLISGLLLALLFWRRRRRRVLREQQIAIRRMTIIGPSPSSTPPSLPYPFTGHGSSTFGNMGNFGTGDIEMSTSKGIAKSDKEAGLPRSKIPALPHQRQQNHVDREWKQTPFSLVVADSASVFTSKQSEIGDGDRKLVGGIYELALDSLHDIDRKTTWASLRGPT